MKVALGQRIEDGPWGGGNRFTKALAGALVARGDQVVFDLNDGDIDVILVTDPRARNPLLSFTPGAVLRYLAFRNPKAVVAQRINECSERKNGGDMNQRLKRANYAADHTVFIASWLRDLDLWRREGGHSVILNGADPATFHAAGQKPWDGQGPIRLVTHHWGAHANKGFDVYRHLDAALDAPEVAARFTFTYIGNLPDGFAFRNIGHRPPLDGDQLAQALREHHAYFTASINEPAGMHHIEGALCGLPPVYRTSGGIPEYCSPFGEGFDGPEDALSAIDRMRDNYARHKEALAAYPHTAERMCEGFLALFDDLLDRRDAIVSARRLWRDPVTFLANQVPW